MARINNTSLMGVTSLLACVIASTAATSSAHGDRTSSVVPAPVWAGQVCDSLDAWQNDVERIITTTRSNKVDAVRARTASLSTDLQRIGSPDVAQGQAVEAALEDAAARLRRTLAAERSSATRSTARLAAQYRIVGQAFITLGTRYPQSDLDASFDQTPICQLIHG
jgi:hypothetical protein